MDAEDKKLLEELTMNIEFLRCSSSSKEAKVGEFWKYLDNQNVLVPYEVPKLTEDSKSDDLSSMECSSASHSSAKSKLPAKAPSTSSKPKQKPKQKPKEKPKEKKDATTRQIEKYLKEDLRFADTVQPTWDEINADLAYYEKQLKKCRCPPNACECKNKPKAFSSDEECV